MSAALLGCAARAPAAAPPRTDAPIERAGGPWTATLRTDHPLVGRIWSTSKRSFIGASELREQLAATRFVLLGEKHDAPDHHRLQRDALAAIVARGRRPAVVFEMVDVDAQPAIDAARDKGADAIGDATTWQARGWDWPLYRPIVDFALSAELPIVAGNYPRARIKASFHGAPIDDAERARFGLDAPYPKPLQDSLEQELIDSHCGHLPKTHLGGFVDAQRLRDGQMAERLMTTATAGGAVLIAGAGHTRTDRGVPLVLANKGQPSVLSVAFIEVEAGEAQPDGYAKGFHATTLPFDLVWFTPALADEDPCAKMK